MKKLELGLYISCQPAFGNEEFYDFEFIKRFALASEYGGAKAIRIEGLDNIKKLQEFINIPIIGLIKKGKENNLKERRITPCFEDINKLYNVGTKIIAVDFTLREGCNKIYYQNLMKKVRSNFSDIKILADISTIEEAIIAEDSKVDYISSTLVGYTYNTKNEIIPNFTILKKMKKHISLPYIAEGGFETSDQIIKALSYSIHGLVIGTAITRPHVMTSKYSKLWEKNNE